MATGQHRTIFLDGVDFINAFQATAPVFPAPDALHEFTMQLGQNECRVRRDAGATVNAVTNSGSNAFHGTLFEFFRNTVLNAKQLLLERAGAPRPPYNLNQYGGSLGGPIRKDKTFFFIYAQQTSRRESQPIIIPTVLTAAERGGDFSDDCPGSSCPIDPRTGQHSLRIPSLKAVLTPLPRHLSKRLCRCLIQAADPTF